MLDTRGRHTEPALLPSFPGGPGLVVKNKVIEVRQDGWVSIGPRHDGRARNRGLSERAFARAGRSTGAADGRTARIGEPCRFDKLNLS
jgi:hypothetical protein